MKRVFSLRFRKRASSLVSTLLVIVVLSTIVVAFMQSMSIERTTAKSVANSLRAELAVDAAVSAAIKQLNNAVTNQQAGGVSYTTWGYYPSSNSEAYYSAVTVGRPSSLNDPNFLTPANTTWLLSAPYTYNGGLAGNADPDQVANLATSNKFNLNIKGVIAPDKRVIEAPWFEIERTTNNGVIHIIRYAYWADDESSRWNIAANRLNQQTNFNTLRKDGANVDEIVMSNSIPVSDALAIAQSLLGKITRGTAAQVISTNSLSLFQTNKFLITTRSISDNRIKYGPTNSGSFRRGMKKLNLNWTDLTNLSIAADTRVNAIADAIEQGATNFLSTNVLKYYPSAADSNPPSVALPASIGREMRQSIGASIIDYLDADFLPTQPATMLSATNTNSPPPPVRLINDMARPAYFGVEASPVINEVQVVWNALSGQTTAQGTVQRTVNGDGSYTYTIPIVWRFELWNMSDQTLPARAYKMRTFYLQQITASAFGFGGDAIPADTEKIFDFGALTFAPGEVKTVEIAQSFTSTGPNNLGTTWASLINGANGISGPSGALNDDEPGGHDRCTYVLFDATTHAWYSVTGYIKGPQSPVDGNNSASPGNAGASKGNRVNDPRVQPMRSYSLNTALTGDVSPTTYDIIGDRDWSSIATTSLSRINNGVSGFNHQHLGFWFDKPRTTSNGSDLLTNAVISHIRNGPMASEGELGNIFDPSWYNPVNRGADSAGANSVPYGQTLRTPFKGGASLRIGQPCGNTNYDANSWILTDVLGSAATNFSSGAYVMDTSQYLPTNVSGQVNANFPKTVVSGVSTNMNLAAVFRLPSLSVTSGAGTNFDTSLIQSEIKKRLTKSGSIATWQNAQPFYLPGEVSELAVWTNTSLYLPIETFQTFPAASTNALNRLNRGDFAREEVLQRSIGLLTTAGSAFRIYAVGQYCSAPVSNPTKITVKATRSVETTAVIQKEFNEANGSLTNSKIRLLDSIYE